MKTTGFLLAALGMLLASCGGGGGAGTSSTSTSTSTNTSTSTTTTTGSGSTSSIASYGAQPASCSVADQRTWLKAYMADQYFWNTSLGVANEAASSMDAYFQSLLFTQADRYSYTQSTTQFTQFFSEGTRTGFGYSLAFSDAAQTILQVRYTEPQSPVGLAGLKRGDTIVSIDGYTPAQVSGGALANVNTEGVSRSFVVRDTSNATRSFTVSSANYLLTPVLTSTVLTAPGGAKVGYLVYQEFITSSASALASAFNAFRAAGVTELIVDLRYNSGGSVTTARNLASMMGGSSLNGQTFAGLRFNAKNSANDFNYSFTSSTDTLPAAPLEGLNRVFVITSSATASASELVINSLKPFRNVITIGGTTYGKPYGFLPRDACGITYTAVNFDSVNALGVGGYTSGLAATCAMSDDLSKALGDPAERRTAAALSYIQTGVCPAVAVNADALQANTRAAQSFGDSVNTIKPRLAEAAFGEITPPAMVAD
ncbi:MAG: peptidase S41 [Polaromonas sp.]|nr:peptidase S41 [Polaromonas sp.]